MKLSDRHIDATASFADTKITLAMDPAINLAAQVVARYTPGFAFRLTKCKSFTRTKTGAAAGVLKIAARTAVAAIAFTADTEVDNALSVTLADIKGTDAEQLIAYITTDGTGNLKNGGLILQFRSQSAKT